ncbi:MAG: Hpt domain-containing protein [Desulfobulbaceae bacterium]|nr:Hpt domain-containing protein [Desulfobulbaceae bacterium]
MNVLKWDKDFAMEQAADDTELLAELITIFKDSLKSDIAIVEVGLSESSAEKICSAAHSIKGAAASLGIQGINEVATAIEEDSRAGGITIAQEKVTDLHQMLAELLLL